MANKSLSNMKQRGKGLPIRHVANVRPLDVFRDVFQMDVDRLFDDFFTGFGLRPIINLGGDLDMFTPRIDITEDDKTIHVNAELPGMDEKDIDINLTSDSITISGEKHEESEHKDEECYCSERSYGKFRRVIPVEDVDLDKAKAVFRKGVLNITLPKLEGSRRSNRKVEVKSQ
ncbi:MAG TPA: Hsp20/alpha crystallin family protein [Deltaproteobacteria bacterium]|nr:Hsp20/alpha crystallin family protein [Deltaproteobacteria bacterium]HPR52252.1 Hsp20/alpha crystallin family protein [Deltaproteobacteria bacterium]